MQFTCFRLVSWPWFDRLIAVVILANIAIMTTKHANEGDSYSVILNVSNAVFTTIFVAEAAIKLLALGLRQYFGSIWNSFDFCLAVGGIVSTAFASGSAGMIMRVFRVLRVFRLVQFSRILQVRFRPMHM
jgi:hypothetical protein